LTKEKVLVVPSEDVKKMLEGKEGLVDISEKEVMDLIKNGVFVDREKAEVNEGWRQVIPYVVMIDGEKVLLMKRTKKQTESRLHNLYSIGVGGHINDEDSKDPIEAFKKGMKREIEEEVDVDIKEMEFLGVINDLSSPVSKVHLGILYLAEVSFRGIREKELFEWKLVEVEELFDYEEGMENWSKIALNGLKDHLMQN